MGYDFSTLSILTLAVMVVVWVAVICGAGCVISVLLARIAEMAGRRRRSQR